MNIETQSLIAKAIIAYEIGDFEEYESQIEYGALFLGCKEWEFEDMIIDVRLY